MNIQELARAALSDRLRAAATANVRDNAEAERQRLQSLADQHRTDGPSLVSMGIDVHSVDIDEAPSDRDIIDLVSATFDMSYDKATRRLQGIDYAAAWAGRVEVVG